MDWDTVAERMGSRNAGQCRTKWSGLAPTMVEAGEWAAGEDRTLLRALLAAGGEAEEWQLDWGGLVEARTAARSRDARAPACRAAPALHRTHAGAAANSLATAGS